MLIRCIRRYGGKVNTNTWAFQVFITAIVKIEVDTHYVALIFVRCDILAVNQALQSRRQAVHVHQKNNSKSRSHPIRKGKDDTQCFEQGTLKPRSFTKYVPSYDLSLEIS